MKLPCKIILYIENDNGEEKNKLLAHYGIDMEAYRKADIVITDKGRILKNRQGECKIVRSFDLVKKAKKRKLVDDIRSIYD